MPRTTPLLLSLLSTSAFASTEIEDFSSLSCANPPVAIGSTYLPPSGHTAWDAISGQRLYRACSSQGSASLGVDAPGGTQQLEVQNLTSDVIAPTSVLVQGLSTIFWPAGSTALIIGPDGVSTPVQLTSTATLVDLSWMTPLNAGESFIIQSNGSMLVDRLVYELDDDRDGDGFAESQGDCDDLNAGINPAAIDIPGDGIDQDCDGVDTVFIPPPFPAMGVMPSCSAGGPIHVVWKDATPGGQVQVYPAPPSSPPSALSSGPCAGTALILTPNITPPLQTTGASGSGYFTVPSLSGNVCGFKMQLVDLTTCAVSSPITLD